MAGGKKLPELEALTMAYRAVQEGAAGVDMGRNIFQCEAPAAMIQAVANVVHDDASPENAFELFRELSTNRRWCDGRPHRPNARQHPCAQRRNSRGDLLHVGDQLEELASVGAEFIHVDVMDGVFCPQITVGPAFVRAIPDMFVKDVHLMIDEPLQTVEAYVDAGASILTFHVEATRHPHRVLQCLAGSRRRSAALPSIRARR